MMFSNRVLLEKDNEIASLKKEILELKEKSKAQQESSEACKGRLIKECMELRVERNDLEKVVEEKEQHIERYRRSFLTSFNTINNLYRNQLTKKCESCSNEITFNSGNFLAEPKNKQFIEDNLNHVLSGLMNRMVENTDFNGEIAWHIVNLFSTLKQNTMDSTQETSKFWQAMKKSTDDFENSVEERERQRCFEREKTLSHFRTDERKNLLQTIETLEISLGEMKVENAVLRLHNTDLQKELEKEREDRKNDKENDEEKKREEQTGKDNMRCSEREKTLPNFCTDKQKMHFQTIKALELTAILHQHNTKIQKEREEEREEQKYYKEDDEEKNGGEEQTATRASEREKAICNFLNNQQWQVQALESLKTNAILHQHNTKIQKEREEERENREHHKEDDEEKNGEEEQTATRTYEREKNLSHLRTIQQQMVSEMLHLQSAKLQIQLEKERVDAEKQEQSEKDDTSSSGQGEWEAADGNESGDQSIETIEDEFEQLQMSE